MKVLERKIIMFSKLSLRFLLKSKNCSRNVSAASKVSVSLDEDVRRRLEEVVIKPRHHPGIIKVPNLILPKNLKDAITSIVGDTPLKQLINESQSLSLHLHSRLLPCDEDTFEEKKKAFTKEVEKKMKVEKEGLTEDEKNHYDKIVASAVNVLLKQRLYNWEPVNFTRHQGLVYMVGRAAAQYAVMRRVFKEIVRNDENFSPKTLFDFGSGIGTVLWAAEDTWSNSLREIFCVDSSADMNDISKEIVEKCYEKFVNNIFHRQFLPASFDRKYDIVVSSYSFLELPSLKSRQQTLLNLWKKCEKYLVIVEYGTMAGFKIINESRDFILNLSKKSEESEKSHVVAPCPHESPCPRTKSGPLPCNFPVSYTTFPQKEEKKIELFSYLIMKKGEINEKSSNWPRIVRPVLNRSRHTICRLCSSKGSLREIIFTPTKHGKIMYRCAKASQWGDLLPINLEESEMNH